MLFVCCSMLYSFGKFEALQEKFNMKFIEVSPIYRQIGFQ